MGYTCLMRYAIISTEMFDKWLRKLRDRQAALAVANRITRAAAGNFGDVQAVGGGVSEMRIFIGKGYRVYFVKRGLEIVLLLCGGDKSSQQNDIKIAKAMAEEL